MKEEKSRESRDYSEYLNMLNQKETIYFEEPIAISGKDKIFEYEFNNVKRYYVKLASLLVNRFNLSKNGVVKSSKFKNRLFFPKMIHAKYKKDKFATFYIEISKEAFDNSGYYKNLRNNTKLINALTKDINNSISNNKVENVAENTVSNDTNNVETKENIITMGSLPTNYNDLIESLKLKENFGILSSEIEKCIQYSLINAKYKVSTYIKYVEKPVPSEYIQAQEQINMIKKIIGSNDNVNGSFNNSTNIVTNSTEDNKMFMDTSKIHVFVEKMKKGLSEKIREEHSEFPWSWLDTRYDQEACAMQYRDEEGHHLTIEKANIANRATPGKFYLGDELLVRFFLCNIFNPKANYEHILNKDQPNEQRFYYPYIQLYDVNGNFNNGLIKKGDYISIMCGVLTTTLFPNATKGEINNEYINKVLNYCDNFISQ